MKLRQQYVDGEWIVWIVNNEEEGESQCECHGDVECAYCTGVEEE